MGFFSDIAPVATLGAGIMTGNPSLITGGLGMLGAGEQGRAAQRGNQQAAALTQFRPVGITNTFGTSNFGFDPTTGQLTSAGYTLSPYLQKAQEAFMSGIPQSLQDTANIQAMGRQYLSTSPEQAAQDWMKSQQALLAPSRELQSANLMNQLSNTGRTGLKVAQGGDLSMSNPEYQALANARALQDLGLASQAMQAGQNRYAFGQGLLSSAYDPYNAGLKASLATEQLGQSPFTLSTNLANTAAGANATSAGYLKNATSYSPMGSFWQSLATTPGIGNSIGKWFGNADLNKAASDWMSANPDITPSSTFNGGGGGWEDWSNSYASSPEMNWSLMY